jgi:hypothetical protein
VYKKLAMRDVHGPGHLQPRRKTKVMSAMSLICQRFQYLPSPQFIYSWR